MLLPTNESFLRSTIEETQIRYQDQTDDEQVLKASRSYQPSKTSRLACEMFHRLGRLFMDVGKRLESLSALDATHQAPAVRHVR
jgi:hypothetical protein